MWSDEDGLFAEEAPKRGGEWITAYCDGGSRGNPGPAGYGVYIEGPDGERLAELSEYLGKATNNVAEYSALLGALEWALQSGHKKLRVVGDSELLVKQMQGRYKVASPDLRPLYEEAKRRVARLEGFASSMCCGGRIRRQIGWRTLRWTRGWGKGRLRAAHLQRPAVSGRLPANL